MRSEREVDQIVEWLDALYPKRRLFGLLSVGTKKPGRKAVSFVGYYQDRRKLARDAIRLGEDSESVNIRLNELRRDCYARSPEKSGPDVPAGSDADISRRSFLFIDVDPVRPTKVSSTKAQVELAFKRAKKVNKYLRDQGLPRVFGAESGNGYHILVPVDEPNDKPTTELFKRILEGLDEEFSDGDVKIDTATSDALRAVKLYGTWSRKGEDIPSQPHRQSCLFQIPDKTRLVSRKQLESLADDLKPKKPVRKQESLRRGAARTPIDLAAWIADHNLEVDDPETRGDGGTIWKFKRCPFNESHVNGDAALFLSPDGQPGFKCFHDGCSKYKWRDVLRLIDPNGSSRNHVSRAHAGDGRPLLVVNDDFMEVETQAATILTEANDPPVIFRSGSALVSVRPNETVRVKAYTAATLRSLLAKKARVIRVEGSEEKSREVPVSPPGDLIGSLLESEMLAELPYLDRISFVPVIAPDGSIRVKPGYDPLTQTHLVSDAFSKLATSEVTEEEVVSAVAWFRYELLADFPFADSASRTHILCALLLPLVRTLIDGPTPLHLIDSPKRSSGKSLLARLAMKITSDHIFDSNWTSNEEELEKRVNAALRQAYTHVLFDNASGTVASPLLDKVLTSQIHVSRLLGLTKTETFQNSAVWFLTANNAELGGDLTSRSILIHLDSEEEYPEKRSDFKIPEILSWVARNRTGIIRKLLVLIRFWIQQGMPLYSGSRTHRMSGWASTMGGICQTTGLKGFLKNADQLEERTDTEHKAASAFVDLWHEEHGTDAVFATELVPIAYDGRNRGTDLDLPGPLWSDEIAYCSGERSKVFKLAKWLTSHRDQIYSGHKIVVIEDKRNGNRYALKETK